MSSRVTQASISSIALQGLQSSLTRVQNLQQQLSSGKQISQPSDDPAGTSASMTFRSQQVASEQYLRNADSATGRLNVTDSTLSSLSDRVRAVRDLMVNSQNGAISQDSRVALSKQIDSLKTEIVSLYNTTYLDRPIFGGTVTGTQAVDPTTGAYIGNDQPLETRISPDTTIRFDVKGTAVAADVLPAALDQVSANVQGLGATAADFDAIDSALSKLQQAIGDVGARSARIDSTRANVDSQRLDLQSRISNNEDVDLPEVIMNLQAQQVGYQAALGTAAKIMQQSLVDFLR